MTDDIFQGIADLEKRADEVVAHARQQAREFRQEVNHKLKELADQLERDHGVRREEAERIIAAQREKLFNDFEQKMQAGLAELDRVRREKVAPLVDRVIKAFLENPHGD